MKTRRRALGASWALGGRGTVDAILVGALLLGFSGDDGNPYKY